jgi:hypothetical protein
VLERARDDRPSANDCEVSKCNVRQDNGACANPTTSTNLDFSRDVFVQIMDIVVCAYYRNICCHVCMIADENSSYSLNVAAWFDARVAVNADFNVSMTDYLATWMNAPIDCAVESHNFLEEPNLKGDCSLLLFIGSYEVKER